MIHFGKGAQKEARMPEITPRPRPSTLHGTTIKMRTGCGNLYVTINEDKYGMFEVFAQLGKTGGCTASQTEAISRLISLALRSGIRPDVIIKQLKGIRCSSSVVAVGGVILSCPDAIAKAMERYLKAKTSDKEMLPAETTLDTYSEKTETILGFCPDCGSQLIYEEGCAKCRSCGYSKCG